MPRLARGIRDTFPDKPWLVADSLTGNLYLSYTTFYRRQGKTTDRIEFQRSEDGGLTWTPASKASPDEEEGLVQGSRPAVGPGGILHLVWKTVDTTAAAGGLDAMRIRSSGDGGRTFGAAFDVARLYTNFCSGPPGFDRGFGLGFPSIAVERGTSHPGRIHVAWEESLNFYDDLLPLTDVVEEVEPNESGRPRHAVRHRSVDARGDRSAAGRGLVPFPWRGRTDRDPLPRLTRHASRRRPALVVPGCRDALASARRSRCARRLLYT
jgi:hypothetical protein